MLDKLSPLQRLLAHVDLAGEHHRWTGSLDPRTGTGQFRLDGKLRSARRAAWELQVGPLPSGVRVRACPTDPRCVRVEHLRLESSRRRIAASEVSADSISQHMTLSAAFPLYLAHLERRGRSQNTLTVYRSIFRRWIDPTLGPQSVNNLDAQRSTAVLDEIRPQAPQAAAVARSILNGLRDWALDEEL